MVKREYAVGKRGLIWLLVLTFLAVLAGICFFAGADDADLQKNAENTDAPGLFCWNPPKTAAEMKEFASIFSVLPVGTVYEEYELEELEVFAPVVFNRSLKELGIAPVLLVGEPEWGLEPDGKALCERIDALNSYNAAVREEERFSGIMVDVEPYVTDGWEENKQEIMKNWCQALVSAKARAAEYGLSMTICIPRWLEHVDEDVLERMITEGCDAVAVMNYGRSDEVEALRTEMALAEKYKKPLIHISELIEPGKHSLTDEQTYYNYGVDAVHASWERLEEAYPNGDIRFAYHYDEPLREIMVRDGKMVVDYID